MAVSLATLRTRAKRRADEENSSFAVDGEWDDYINEGLAELHELVVNKSDDHLLSSTTVSVVSGTDTYALPNDFLRERGVDMISGSDTYTLRPFMFPERNNLNNLYSDAQYGGEPGYMYQILGNNIRFIPVPSGSFSAKLWYVPQVTQLSDDADEIDVAYALGWERYVVLYAAIKVLQKQEKDVSALTAELMVLQNKIEKNAKRNDGEPRRVVDMRYGRRVRF